MQSLFVKDLSLSDWRAQSNAVSFGSRQNTIKGDNGVGKSSLFKAWCWLFTSQTDPLSNKNANLFDDSVPTTPDTPPACVKATIVFLNGETHTLERTAKSKFTRKRATSEYEKDKSDEYKTLIDGVEYSARDFDGWVETHICDLSVLPYLISGDFFLVKCVDDKKKMRDFLSTVVGDVEDSELTGDYSQLLPLIANADIDIVVKQYKSLKKNSEDRKKEIPALIKADQASIASYDQSYDFVALDTEANTLNSQITGIDQQLAGASEALKPYIDARNRAVADRNSKQQALDMARKNYDDMNAKMRMEFEQAIEKARRDNAGVEGRNAKLDSDRKFKESQLEAAKRDLEMCRNRRLKLKEEQAQVKARIFTADKCAYCGQSLPEEEVEKARQRFNDQKAADNAAIVQKGRANNNDIQMYEERVAELTAQLEQPIQYEQMQDLQPLYDNLAAFNNSVLPYEQMEEYKTLLDAVNAVVIPELPKQDTTALTEKKKELMERLNQVNQSLGVKAVRARCVKNIEDLRVEQKTLETNIAGYEQVLVQAKQYTQEKMEIISSRVNEHLEYANVQMFSVQKDGSEVDDLIIKDKNGISYSTTNGASRILMAVDMQRFFCERNGIQMPIWIDEASIINPARLAHLASNQVIKLMYADCPLTIEYK